MSDVPSVAELDALTTEELRHRAFERAERHHDVRFFWDLVRHLRPTENAATEDGSAGNITGTVAEAVEATREMLGADLGDMEPLVRARFIDYIRQPE